MIICKKNFLYDLPLFLNLFLFLLMVKSIGSSGSFCFSIDSSSSDTISSSSPTYKFEMKFSHFVYSNLTVFSGMSKKRLNTSSLVLLTLKNTGKKMMIAKTKETADIIKRVTKQSYFVVVLSTSSITYYSLAPLKAKQQSLKRLYVIKKTS